jgi:hypothetical protein
MGEARRELAVVSAVLVSCLSMCHTFIRLSGVTASKLLSS